MFLVTFFDAFLADIFGAAIIGRIFAGLQPFSFFLVDPADITNHVGSSRPQWILTKQTRLNIDSGKAVTLRGKTGDFFVREAGTDWQTFEGFRFFHQATEALAVLGLNVHQLRQFINHDIELTIDFGGCNLQRVRRIVTGQNNTVTIDNQTAIGNGRHHRDAVALCALRILAMAHRLQP